MAADTYMLYDRAEYFSLLTELAGKAQRGDRIAVASMTFDTRAEPIAKLMTTLSAAAKRGVTVHLSIDAYTFLALDKSIVPGPLWFHRGLPTKLPEPFKGWRASLQDFAANGGHYGVTNQPGKTFTMPYAGRSHIKAAVINSYVLVGGCNLQNPEHVDVMAGRTSKTEADWIYRWLLAMVATESTGKTYGGHDRTLTVDANSQIIIDAGVANQSSIYDQALRLIDTAQERIYLTCQFFPGGKTGQHLLAAHKRGVDVHIVYSPASIHGQKSLGHFLYNSRERLRLPASFFTHAQPHHKPLVHAKVLVTEQASMVGSHNYVSQGVSLGTAEIALYNRNPAFGKKLIRKIDSLL